MERLTHGFVVRAYSVAQTCGIAAGSARQSADEFKAYGAYTGGDVELVSMTLKELDALQTTAAAFEEQAEFFATRSSAPWRGLLDRCPPLRKFNAACQDETACTVACWPL